MKKWISLLGILCMSLVVIFNVEAKTQVTSQEQVQDGAFSIKNNEIDDEFVQGTYPEITAADDLSAKVKINEQLDNTLDKLKSQLKAQNDNGSAVVGDLSYTVKTNDKDLLSIEIDCVVKHKQDDSDAGNMYVYGLNFDNQGNLVDFAQIVQSSKVSKADDEDLKQIEQQNNELWQQMDTNIANMQKQMNLTMKAISNDIWGSDNMQTFPQD